MEATGKNLEYIINEARKMYSEQLNKWIIDIVDKYKLNLSNVTLTTHSCPGVNKVDYKLIGNKTGAIYGNLQIENKIKIV